MVVEPECRKAFGVGKGVATNRNIRRRGEDYAEEEKKEIGESMV
jgi:hypothetical protein